ncbi:DinB family protein [Melghirimyces profundicolus]|uniref:DinB family protein n=1 Tax=Melghirimyces profundicolus TaxID=1242148 RepID=A0A2T6AUL5_9BACL|nr:DinB family protein [Melghirimyces profundicolus]PTX47510.1 DinB family protein [Melghirimyces profundicolus]
MKGKKELLLDQLAACRDDPSWFPPLSRALKGLTAEEALWREDESMKTIWQIVHHLTFWNERWLSRFMGEPTSGAVDNNWTFEVKEVSGEDWQNAVTRLETSLADWQTALSKCADFKLYEPIPDYPEEAPWWGAVSNLCTHHAFHIGQIVRIRQRQGSW